MGERVQPGKGGEPPASDTDFGAGSKEETAAPVADSRAGPAATQRAETHLTPRRPNPAGPSNVEESIIGSDFEPVETPVVDPDESRKWDYYRLRGML